MLFSELNSQNFDSDWGKFQTEIETVKSLPVKSYEAFESKHEKSFTEHPSEAMKFYGNYAYALLNEKDEKNALEALKYCYHYATRSSDTTLKAIAIYRFGDYYRITKNFSEAEKYYAASLAPLAAIIGASSREYSEIYYEYMNVLMALRKLDEAKPGIEALIYYYKTIEGVKSKEYAVLSSLLADIYTAKGNYQKGLEILNPLVDQNIFLELKDTTAHVSLIVDLGDIHREMGNYDQAFILFKKAKRDFFSYKIKDQITLAIIENNLALCSKMKGQYQEAEESFNAALRLYEGSGKEHTNDYCVALNNKGDMFRELGRHGLASELLLRSLLIQKQYLDTGSRVYANTLNNLGLVYMDAGYYDEALLRTEQSRRSYERLLGTEHQFYGNCLNNISFLYMMKNDYKSAQEYKSKALTIVEKSVGKDHYRYITFLISSGGLAMHTKEFTKAEEILKESVLLCKKNFGEKHELTARAKLLLAEVYAQNGDFLSAGPMFLQSIEVFSQQLNTYFNAMSEENQAHYYASLEPAFQSFNIFLLNYRLKEPKRDLDEYIKQALKNQLLIKSLLGRNSARLQKEINGSSDKQLKEIYSEWIRTKNELINLTKFNSDIEKENELVKKVSELEATLKLKTGHKFTEVQSDFYSIQKSLKAEEGALEIFRVNERINDSTGSVKYGALIIRSDKQTPSLVIFKNGDEMDGRYYEQYTNCMENDQVDSISYAVYFSSLQKNLNGLKKVYVSADGVFQKISLAGLQDQSTGKFVTDAFSTVMVSNLNAIESSKKVEPYVNKVAVLFGNPDYDYDFIKEKTLPQISSEAVAKRYGLSGISKLPGTKTEVNSIAQSLLSENWKVNIYTEEKASEKNLRMQRSPAILHIATHGYYLSDIETDSDFFLGFESKNLKENSYLRSGIILAGAVPSSYDSLHTHSDNDGILTAYDASLMDLSDTKLVVLSACQTGLGDNMGSQGVAGLQRSFAIAGAENIIMSLWPVEDQSTQFMMSEFYHQYAKGIDIETAYRNAQNVCRKKHPHPSYWAAFVLLKGLK